MRSKARFYRVRLVAYDAVNNPSWHLPPGLPSPTPALSWPRKQKRLPRKIHLVKLALSPFAS